MRTQVEGVGLFFSHMNLLDRTGKGQAFIIAQGRVTCVTRSSVKQHLVVPDDI